MLVVKNLLANARDLRDMGLVSESRRYSGGGNGNPLQYSFLENPMDRRALWATVWGLKSQRGLNQLSTHTKIGKLAYSFCSVSHVWLFATPCMSVHQTSLSFTISRSLLKLMSFESVMPSNHLILCQSLLILPSIFPSNHGLFQWVGSSYQVAKVLELQLQHQSFQWIFMVDFL